MGQRDIKKPHLAKYYRNQQGKDYIEYGGLVAEFHLLATEWIAEHPDSVPRPYGIQATLIQIPHPDNGNCAIASAVVSLPDGSQYQDIGDADDNNLNRMIATARMRMASTRAKGRALRDATNIGVTMYEELPDAEELPEGDEFASREDDNPARDAKSAGGTGQQESNYPPSESQLRFLKQLADQHGVQVNFAALTKSEASTLIEGLKTNPLFQHARLTTAHRDLPLEGRAPIPHASPNKPASANQLATISKLSRLLGQPEELREGMTSAEASERITDLSHEYNERKGSTVPRRSSSADEGELIS